MKTKFFKLFIATIALALSAFTALAQTSVELEEKSLPTGEFTSVNVTGDFEVTLTKGTYGSKVTVNKSISEYVEVYVRSKVLYINYNEKAVPKDVKKAITAKGAPKLVFRAVVYAPQLEGITLEDNAVLTGTDTFYGSSFSLQMKDKAQLKNLSVTATKASVSLKDKAQAVLILNADTELTVKTDDSANLKLTTTCVGLSIEGTGASKLTASANADSFKLAGTGRSELTLSGKTNTLEVKAEKNTKLDTRSLAVPEVTATMTGGSLRCTAESVLDVDLSGGSELYFTGAPQMKIRKIVKSTLAPDDKK